MTQSIAPKPVDRSSALQDFWNHYGRPAVGVLGRFLICNRATLNTSGIGMSVWVQAVLLTAVTLAIVNTWLSWSVDRSYATARLPAINDARSTDEAVLTAVALIGADEKMAKQDFVREAFRERPKSGTCRQYVISIIRAVQGDVSPQVEQALDQRMTGNRHGSRFYVIRTEGVSGTAIVDLFRQIDPTWNHKTALLQDSANQTKSKDADAFLAKFIDRAAQESRASLRNLMRFNGWIQWWTVCVCWLILLLVFGRAALLAHLVTTMWFHGTFPSTFSRFLASCVAPSQIALPQTSSTIFAARSPVDALLDRQVYSTYEFLVTLLPSLGFIGTVIGMGDALLTADSLFAVSDKSMAISTITSHLGFAFDTTLVGLVTGIIAGSAVLQLRLWENSLWLANDAPPSINNLENGSHTALNTSTRLNVAELANTDK